MPDAEAPIDYATGMGELERFIGAFICIGAFTWAMKWALRKGLKREPSLASAHALSLGISIILFGVLQALGPFSDVAEWINASILYVIAQAIWLAVDVRRNRARAKAQQ